MQHILCVLKTFDVQTRVSGVSADQYANLFRRGNLYKHTKLIFR